MKKKDILELKRRLKKDHCTFTRLCGCYVNSEKNIILDLKETFLNLQEDEFYKYLEIAKKTLSGTIGNNLLQLDFPYEEDISNSKQHFFMELKNSKLKNDELINDFYKTIIDSYDYAGNFLILIFHDAYDVITKTTDNSKLDESEEVYEYLLCAICPVTLAKPALGYIEEENRIGARVRDWVVGAPDVGFLFPAFINRSADVNSIMYYTRNPKDPHAELMEGALGCSSKRTATEQKETFSNIIRNALGGDEKKTDYFFMEIQDNLNNVIEEHNIIYDKNEDSEPIILTNDAIQDILVDSGVPEEITEKIEKSYRENFNDEPPIADHLIDQKALAAKAQKRKEDMLQKQVEILQDKLEKTQEALSIEYNKETAIELEENNSEEASIDTPSEDYDIILKVKPEKVPEIKSEIINGKRCIIIPVEDNEQANVNGSINL